MSKRWILAALLAIGVLSAATLNARAEEQEKEEGKETKVKFDQVPAAAQKTLTEEAKGAKIETVDKEEDEGKVIYEADVTLNGKNYEIKVAEDGTLLVKKLDEGEKDEKGEGKKGDKDEEKEKK
jgi:uncharacterized membrane protein YkoI